MKLTLASLHSAKATEALMEVPREISSGVNIVRAVPSSAEPWRREDPDAWQQASISVVFPAPPWPTTTTLRMRSVVYTVAEAMGSSGAGDWEGRGGKGASINYCGRRRPVSTD